MTRLRAVLIAAVVALATCSLASQAYNPLPLQGRDINGKPVAADDPRAVFEYDPNLNITWLRDWNVNNGLLTWYAATAWAASVTYFGGGWRLPSVAVPDVSCGTPPSVSQGFFCRRSELGYMYYIELINPPFTSLRNPGPFLNVQHGPVLGIARPAYATNREYLPGSSTVYHFAMNGGFQATAGKEDLYYAVAVRDGDVASYPATTATAIEYYHVGLDHYFITWMPSENTKLDLGTEIRGWVRTGYSFKTYTAAQSGTSPVCRYYIPPTLGDSHFYGRGTAECNATGQNNPSFVLESPDFMHMILPAAGTCPVGTTPVYRVFSNRPDANHRYMTDRAVREQMVAKGWLAEGDGPDLVVMCAP